MVNIHEIKWRRKNEDEEKTVLMYGNFNNKLKEKVGKKEKKREGEKERVKD